MQTTSNNPTQGNPFKESEAVLGVPIDQSENVPAPSARNNLPVISSGFCVPHDVVFTLQANLNPRSTEIYNVVDSAGTGQFRSDHGSETHTRPVSRQCAALSSG